MENKTIILVESWEPMRKFIRETIKTINGVIIEKEFDGIESVKKHLVSSDASILICEIPANSERKVFDAIRQIKAIKPEIKIILSTLTYSKKLEEEAKRYGADRIWQKEISEKYFLDQLKSVL